MSVVKKGTISINKQIWCDVLESWCDREVVKEFQSLTVDGQEKMLSGLKSNVMRLLMSSLKDNLLSSVFNTNKTSFSASEELLNRAVRSEGACITFTNFYTVKQELWKWGKVKTKEQILQEDKEAYSTLLSMSENNAFPFLTSDHTVTKRGSKTKSISNMKNIFVKDLLLFETSKYCYIDGTLVGNPRLMVGLTVILEDDNGDVIQTALYNVIPQGRQTLAETLYSCGTMIRIIEPFMKIFNDGNRGIRVDDPSDVCILGENTTDIESIRQKGKEYMELGEHFMAFELYYKGVRDRADSVVDLLNKRYDTEIELGEFEEALLDAAAALFFGYGEELQTRYCYAYQRIEDAVKADSPTDVWIKILMKHNEIRKCRRKMDSTEAGKKLLRGNNFEKTSDHFSSSCPDICLLLTNVAITCIKLNMFQTAIAASSTCLRISNDTQRRQKAIYAMSQSFLMLGEVEMYKIISSQLRQRKELDRKLEIVENSENIFHDTVKECCTKYQFKATVSEFAIFCSKSEDLVCDFLKPNSIEHVYIDGKGRGVHATRDIRIGELLIVDHPVATNSSDIIESGGSTFVCNQDTKIMDGYGHISLITKLLNVIRYDAVLCDKLLNLETRKTADDGNELPLVDLKLFSYRRLSDDVRPFLSQTNEQLNREPTTIDESFIKMLLMINSYEYDVDKNDLLRNDGCALALRISLLNHSKHFNCRVIPFGEALVLGAIKDIPKGTELTIQYNEDVSKWGIKE